MIGTIGSVLYVAIGIITTWFNYEMLKFLTEAKKRKVTDKYYESNRDWYFGHESASMLVAFILNPFIWPIITPLLWFSEWYRKPENKKQWKNPMRWAIREVFEPKENV